jgi:hypothetical protein
LSDLAESFCVCGVLLSPLPEPNLFGDVACDLGGAEDLSGLVAEW